MISTELPAPSAEQAMADRLYPTTAANRSPPIVPPTDRAADRPSTQPAPMKAEELPAEVAALRNEPARRIFSAEKTYASTGIATLFTGQPNAVDEVHSWSNILSDHDASPQEASALIGLVRTVRSDPPTDETVESWGRQALAQVRQQYGDRADDLLAAARRLVARDPRVSRFLVDSGLGSHPRVVNMLIEKAASLRSAGHLK